MKAIFLGCPCCGHEYCDFECDEGEGESEEDEGESEVIYRFKTRIKNDFIFIYLPF
jgi:hypothetical protein